MNFGEDLVHKSVTVSGGCAQSKTKNNSPRKKSTGKTRKTALAFPDLLSNNPSAQTQRGFNLVDMLTFFSQIRSHRADNNLGSCGPKLPLVNAHASSIGYSLDQNQTPRLQNISINPRINAAFIWIDTGGL